MAENPSEQNGQGPAATIRELYRAIQEQQERLDHELSNFRSEVTARLDVVLKNQQTAAVAVAERNGRDDARIAALELAIMKTGDTTGQLTGQMPEITGRLNRVESDIRTGQTETFIRGIVASVITSLFGTSVLTAALMAAGVLKHS